MIFNEIGLTNSSLDFPFSRVFKIYRQIPRFSKPGTLNYQIPGLSKLSRIRTNPALRRVPTCDNVHQF